MSLHTYKTGILQMKTTCYIYFLLLVFAITSCEDKNSYILKGNIKGLRSSEIYIVSGSELHLDSVKAKSGKFTYRGVSPTIEPLRIYLENGCTWITIWVQNGEKFILTGDANYPEMMMVKGGEINRLLSEFKQDNSSTLKQKCELIDKMSAHLKLSASSNMNINDSQLSSQLKNVDQILKMRAKDFVEAHPSSIASLVMIHDYILDFENASNIQPFLNLLTDEVKANPLYAKLQARSSKDLKTKAGQPALNFSIRTTKNDTVNLETFKDKYLILTFATSQCEFCKPEYAELLAIRDSFSTKDLAIFTVSLDENRENWKQLAEEEGINWTQAIDSTGWASKMASQYNVMSVPCNYLIDNKGMIIGSKLRVDSIQSLLKSKIKIQKPKKK